MTAPTATAARSGVRQRAARHVESPLVRAGYALISSAGITSVLGLLFWTVAARRYSPAAVGASVALLSAMEVVAAIANLGLKSALTRFVPGLGPRAPRVVAVSYALTAGVAVVGASVFVAVHDRWYPELTFLDDPTGGAFFVVSAGLWVVFILQDSVLVGARRAGWVPVENTLFALAKLGLLFALVAPMPGWGVYVAWTLPLLAVVVGVNVALFARVLPAQGQAQGEVLTVGDLVRFSAGDYAASGLWLATIDLLPLLVLGALGAAGSAYYALSWMFAYTLYLVSSAVGSALIAEVGHDPDHAEEHAARAARQSFTIVIPAALLVAVAAPWLLELLGPQYRAEATTLLRLMALSAIPHVVTGLYVNLARARRQIRRVVALYAVLCGSVLALSMLLVGPFGVTGAGIAWLATQCVLAGVLSATAMRSLWLDQIPTRWIRLATVPTHWLEAQRAARQVREAVPQVLDELRSTLALSEGAQARALSARTGEVVVEVVDRGTAVAVVKLVADGGAEAARRREQHVLTALAADDRLGHWRAYLPQVLGHGQTEGQTWFAESAAGAVDGTSRLATDGRDDVVRAGVAAITPLHERTAEAVRVGEQVLSTLVDQPASVLLASRPDLEPSLKAVAERLRAELSGRSLLVSRVHGDLHPGNLVFASATGPVCGIVDWVTGRAVGLPEVDVLTLAVSTRADAQGEELGAVFARCLSEGLALDDQVTLALLPSAPANRGVPASTLVLLCWLHHVAANLSASAAYATNEVWVSRNLQSVLRAATTETHREGRGDAEIADLRTPDPEPELATTTVCDEVGSDVATITPPHRTRTALDPQRRATQIHRLVLAATMLGPLLWWLGFRQIGPRQLGDLGTVAELPLLAFTGLALLIGAFAVTVTRPVLAERLATLQCLALVGCLHAVPIAVYGTMRYEWAWKHVGVVDFIARNGATDPSLDIYQNWPGFFAGAQSLVALTGLDNAIQIARWAPAFFAVMVALGVALVAGALTTDRRIVWAAVWFATFANWIGQEYFSPQATCFVLYLAALGLAMRSGSSGSTAPRPGQTGPPVRPLVLLASLVVITAAVASTHQLTPLMLTVALAGLALLARLRVGAVAVLAGAFTVGWALWMAHTFVSTTLVEEITSLSTPLANAEATLDKSANANAGLAQVALIGRLTVVLVGVLATAGLVRWWRAGNRDRRALVLLFAPAALLLGNSFGGEILLRVVMFASPLLGFFAAWCLLGTARHERLSSRRAIVVFAVSAVLALGFLVAHFGKDGHYVFTENEVAAAAFVYETAPDGSLLIEGSRNYPAQFVNYERFRYVPIDREDFPDQRRIGRDPASVLGDWMQTPGDEAAYLLITRSQKRAAEALGSTPPGLLDDIERALRADGAFEVAFENADAVVFTRSDQP